MRCPYVRTKTGKDSWGNVVYEEDFCELTEKPSGRIHHCILQSGDTCEEWEKIQKEEIE